MSKISIARALAEHKLIDKKIEKVISQSRYCALKKGRKTETTDGISLDDFNSSATSNYDKLQALLKQKNALKAAIIVSNATTMVTVGKTEMTVAAAIERKQSIEIENRCLSSMKMEYVRVKSTFEAENQKVQSKLDQLLESNFNAGKGGGRCSECNRQRVRAHAGRPEGYRAGTMSTAELVSLQSITL